MRLWTYVLVSQDTYSMQCMAHVRDTAGCASHAEDDVSDQDHSQPHQIPCTTFFVLTKQNLRKKKIKKENFNLYFWFLTVSPNNSHREPQGTNPCFSFRLFYGSCLRDFHVRVSQSKSFTKSHVYKYIDKSHKP